ncbi:MAG: Fic family protein [Ruminococcus sp.]|nr:Fic family protein [Ruminococcus sp.]
MYSYDGLLKNLNEKNMTRSTLADKLGVSSRTIAKISRGEKIAEHVIKRIAEYFECEPQELYREVSDNPLLQMLRDEKSIGMTGGIYHELQVRMTYNSNHIEGSKLSEAQTRMIYETYTVNVSGGIPVDDILETVQHFRAIDYVIDAAEEPLTEDIIKELHRILKQNTKDSTLSWFAVGDYKKRANVVGGHETTKPKDVPARMKGLLSEYESISNVNIEDIIRFHYDFESIHPFQDGNGRVGRLIALKECLRYRIVPFIIEDSKKNYYYRGLSQWNNEPGYLTDTCLDGQDMFRRLLRMFEIEE